MDGKKGLIAFAAILLVFLVSVVLVLYVTSQNLSPDDSSADVTGLVACGNLDYGTTNSPADNVISLKDLSHLTALYGKNCRTNVKTITGCGPVDYNLDGKIDDIDLKALMTKWNMKCDSPEIVDCGDMDANSDIKITLTDFSTLSSKFGKVCRSYKPVSQTSSFLCGGMDFNQDAKINGVDFASLRHNFGKSCKSVTLPAEGTIYCGALDDDSSGSVDALDIRTLVEMKGTKCATETTTSGKCGAKDSDNDGIITDTDIEAANAKLSISCK